VTAPAADRAAAARSLPGLAPGRRPELDLMRGLVVAGLVVFHSAVVFAAGASWFVKDPRPGGGFTVFLLWGSLWGMRLLFLVSGMSARHAMRTRSPAAFVRERLARLLVPFAFGLVVLVPPMFYIARLGQPAFHQPYWRFWLSFVNVPAIARELLPRGSWTSGGVTFDPAHLWFLYVLLLFTLALLPLFTYLGGPRGRLLTSALAGFAERHAVVVVLAAAVPMMAGEAQDHRQPGFTVVQRSTDLPSDRAHDYGPHGWPHSPARGGISPGRTCTRLRKPTPASPVPMYMDMAAVALTGGHRGAASPFWELSGFPGVPGQPVAVSAVSPSASRRRVAASWLRAVSGIPSGSLPPFAARSAAPPMYLAARRSNAGGNKISAGSSACPAAASVVICPNPDSVCA
jgi:hypothetical protein